MTARARRPSGVEPGGRVAESGTHQALMDRDGIYAELFNLQAEGYRS